MFTSRASSSVVYTTYTPNACLLLPLTQKGRKLLKPNGTEWKNHRGSKALKKKIKVKTILKLIQTKSD